MHNWCVEKTNTLYWMLALMDNGICVSHNAWIMQEYSVSLANQDRFPADNVIIPKCQNICKYVYQPSVLHAKQKQWPWNLLCRLNFLSLLWQVCPPTSVKTAVILTCYRKKMRVFLVPYFRSCIPFGTTYPGGKRSWSTRNYMTNSHVIISLSP